MFKIRFVVIIAALILCIFSCNVLAQQSSNLTDRELLIQLTAKVGFIEESVKRIESNEARAHSRTNTLENQVTKNEINIAGFCDRLDSLMVRWNALLFLFATFILGIFVFMWRKAYSVKNSKVAKGSE